MSDVAIRVDALGKRFRIGSSQASYRTLRDTLGDVAAAPARAFARVFGRGRKEPPGEDVWALRDITFDIKRGEVIGVVGRNGAGKSTLLKILSRITEPTTGYAEIRGRVGSLLEVGTGFHPELSGRENIYLNGAILGMKRSELGRKFDEMIAFAGVEKFIDTPVKHYSSGMYLRLAFSVAAHMEPDILLVDEVLAVGDAAFQDKCLGKMKEVSAAGRTVLLVTHNMGAVQSLCPRSLLLSDGRLEAFGDSSEIIGKYLMPEDNSTGRVTLSPAQTDAYFTAISLLAEDGHPTTKFDVTRSLTIEFRYKLKREIPALTVSFSLFNRQGMKVFYCPETRSPASASGYPPGDYCARVTIPRMFLAPGQYYITAGTYITNRQMFDLRERVAHFEIAETGSPHYAFAGLDNGCVLVDFPWTVQQESVETVRA